MYPRLGTSGLNVLESRDINFGKLRRRGCTAVEHKNVPVYNRFYQFASAFVAELLEIPTSIRLTWFLYVLLKSMLKTYKT